MAARGSVGLPRQKHQILNTRSLDHIHMVTDAIPTFDALAIPQPTHHRVGACESYCHMFILPSADPIARALPPIASGLPSHTTHSSLPFTFGSLIPRAL